MKFKEVTLMKRYFLIVISCAFIIVLPLISQAHQPQNEEKRGFSLKQDRWDKDRFNFIDPKTGLPTEGYIKKDRWAPDKRWNIYDKKHQKKGIIEKDRWDDDRWNILEN